VVKTGVLWLGLGQDCCALFVIFHRRDLVGLVLCEQIIQLRLLGC